MKRKQKRDKIKDSTRWKRYYEEHKDEIIAANKQYYRDNIDVYKEYFAKRYQKKRKKLLIYAAKYRKLRKVKK